MSSSIQVAGGGGSSGGGGGSSSSGGGGGGGGGGVAAANSSSSSSSRYEIPGELQQLLLDFTVCCLVEHPANLIDFAADYFIQLQLGQRTLATGASSNAAVAAAGAAGDLPDGSSCGMRSNANGHSNEAAESDDSMLTDDSDEPLPGNLCIRMTSIKD